MIIDIDFYKEWKKKKKLLLGRRKEKNFFFDARARKIKKFSTCMVGRQTKNSPEVVGAGLVPACRQEAGARW